MADSMIEVDLDVVEGVELLRCRLAAASSLRFSVFLGGLPFPDVLADVLAVIPAILEIDMQLAEFKPVDPKYYGALDQFYARYRYHLVDVYVPFGRLAHHGQG